MRAVRLTVLFLCAVACGDNEVDIVGPFSGETRRYIVDSIVLPMTNTEINAFADDLNGDGEAFENLLGQDIVQFAYYGDITMGGSDMIASGAIRSYVDVTAGNLENDWRVGVTYVGAEGEPGRIMGGTLVDGAFRSNRTRSTRVPGTAVAYLPVFVDADPLRLPMFGVEIDLDPDGKGGFKGVLRGGVHPTDAREAAFIGISQMLKADPTSHFLMFDILDAEPHDWIVTNEEIMQNSLFVSLLAADTTIQGVKADSLAFRIHLSPCDAGSCTMPRLFDRCDDRIKDGNESDVDCGGYCRACTDGVACNVDQDCESRACDAGLCRAPTCADGLRDGVETDVDCGSLCAPCGTHQRCWKDADCQSGKCGGPDHGSASFDICAIAGEPLP